MVGAGQTCNKKGESILKFVLFLLSYAGICAASCIFFLLNFVLALEFDA